ncbi:hypothetical protein D8682_25215 [Buttiauxella sp. 3AFRM03]|uniref:hypothetical protein n=1 Tax=Buttiauxella sp. 3AFRM03 TaxID=2479367 RepID=UPI000EF83260|nr:hypothetical protein [Buttiauxella sp. 3AFRM03]AYN29985.1 hypothetical protein D8682_25215 [Buttiauxella sp. 3AFRM03]
MTSEQLIKYFDLHGVGRYEVYHLADKSFVPVKLRETQHVADFPTMIELLKAAGYTVTEN